MYDIVIQEPKGQVTSLSSLHFRALAKIFPLTIQNQPVVLGLGGAAERIRKDHARYLATLQRAAKTVKPEGAFDQPIDIEF